MKRTNRSFMLAFAMLSFKANAQDHKDSAISYPDVNITARVPAKFSESPRSISIITDSGMREVPVRNLNELLENITGVDIRQRGPGGVQADISIRGESFENVLILVNGIRVNDPQTGHHNLNLPVALEDIERVEVLRGPAARIHGQNAFSGVVNFITRKPDELNVRASASAGDFEFYRAHASVSAPIKKYKQSLSFTQSAAGGYRPHTDFQNSNLLYQSAIKISKLRLEGAFGWNNKAFGANSFYSDKFPTQWEATQAWFGHIAAHIDGKWQSRANVYYRQHHDEFLLKKENPAFYKNTHVTDIAGIDFNTSRKWKLGRSSVGAELRKEKINSSNLGGHERLMSGIYFEHAYSSKRLNVTPGIFMSWYSDYDIQFYPGIDLSYAINENLRLYGTANRAYRVPTYTDIYYKDPVNRGNPSLKPEEAYSAEAGFRYLGKLLQVSSAYFYKEGSNIIDYGRIRSDSPWVAMNLGEVLTQGLEGSLSLHPQAVFGADFIVKTLGIQYTWLNSSRDKQDLLSKYVNDFLRHQLILSTTLQFRKKLFFSSFTRFEDRVSYKKYWVTDMRLAYVWKQFRFDLTASNVFDQKYYEFMAIPMPGRWFSGGISWQLR